MARPRGTYVGAQVIAAIRAHGGPGRLDRAKLLRLIDELNDNYAKGSTYATHAVLRALLDHIPPLLGCTSFTAVANNYPWSRTDKAYMRRLLDFKLQADDAMHRQISAKTDLLSLHDIPPRAWVNRLLQECASASQAADLDALISNRESASLEFKQTMQWDRKLHRRNPELLRACVKTVCAFLNGSGGTLLIGVADSGVPVGLEDELQDFADRRTVDGFELRLRGALVGGLYPEVSPSRDSLVSVCAWPSNLPGGCRAFFPSGLLGQQERSSAVLRTAGRSPCGGSPVSLVRGADSSAGFLRAQGEHLAAVGCQAGS